MTWNVELMGKTVGMSSPIPRSLVGVLSGGVVEFRSLCLTVRVCTPHFVSTKADKASSSSRRSLGWALGGGLSSGDQFSSAPGLRREGPQVKWELTGTRKRRTRGGRAKRRHDCRAAACGKRAHRDRYCFSIQLRPSLSTAAKASASAAGITSTVHLSALPRSRCLSGSADVNARYARGGT
jgi:hypothetical protein